MRMSKLSQLAVTVLIEVGLREHEGPVSLAVIQSSLAISTTRLEQVFSKLRQSQLVDSTRGPGGGYCLADASEKISVADIVLAMEPMEATPDTLSGKGQDTSVSHRLWCTINQKILHELQNISLRQLLSAQRNEVAGQFKLRDQAVDLRATMPSRPETPWWPVPSVMSAS